eukprot:scaffold211567_cov19-Tisochrysis_lutea.AAC.1
MRTDRDSLLAQAEREYNDALERARRARERTMAAHGYTPLAVLDDDDEPEANEGERTAVAGVPVEIAPEEARETCAMWADSDSDSGFGGASSELSRAGASIETRDKTAERGDAAALVAFLEANVATESAELIEMLEY